MNLKCLIVKVKFVIMLQRILYRLYLMQNHDMCHAPTKTHYKKMTNFVQYSAKLRCSTRYNNSIVSLEKNEFWFTHVLLAL